MQNFIVVGEMRAIVAQVLLAIHHHTTAHCAVISGKGTGALRLSRLCSQYDDLDFYGHDDLRFVEIVNRFAARHADTVLVAGDCQAMKMVNRVRDALQVGISPMPDTDMLSMLEDKWSFYQFCKAHGLTVPSSIFVNAKAELDFSAVANRLGLPFVVKPLDQVASYGIEVVQDENHYKRAILDNRAYQYAPLIMQRFIAGKDIGLNLLSVHGRVMALACQEPNGTRVRFFANGVLERAAHVIASATRYHGVMNVDARVEEHTGTIYLFESNPRIWRSHYASVWCGMNFCGESLKGRWDGNHVQRLVSGESDVYYHPIFRPSQWPMLLFDKGRRGRFLRIMMSDPYTLASSIRPLLQGGWQKLNWMLLRRRVKRVY